jgi:hypothetical protein
MVFCLDKAHGRQRKLQMLRIFGNRENREKRSTGGEMEGIFLGRIKGEPPSKGW